MTTRQSPGWVEVQRCVRPPEAVQGAEGAGAAYGHGPWLVGRPGEPGQPEPAATRSRWRVGAGQHLVLDAYATGFPAAAWHDLSTSTLARFRGHLTGSGRLSLFAVDAAGTPEVVQRWAVGEPGYESADPGGRPVEVAFPIGGRHEWLWLELEAEPDPGPHAAGGSGGPTGDQPAAGSGTAWGLSLDDAAFEIRSQTTEVRIGVALTTLDRRRSCLDVMSSLAMVPDSLLTRVVVVDHGATALTDHPDHAQVARWLGDRLTVVRQRNLGGSGGFSRGMNELLHAGPSAGDRAPTHLLLLDDDILLDPETVRRAGAMAEVGFAGIVGAHMLHATTPWVLHSTGEVISKRGFIWQTPATGLERVDLRVVRPSGCRPLRTSHLVDFSGWWAALVPASFVRQSGLAMPYFIKWDDVEFGLRAAAAGVVTRTLPGLGVWHVPWVAKDTAVDWQVFHLTRNRLVTAALHGPRMPLRLVTGLAARALEHAATMAYDAGDLAVAGMRAFRAGPQSLVADQARGSDALAARRAPVEVGPPELDDPVVRQGATRPAADPTGQGSEASTESVAVAGAASTEGTSSGLPVALYHAFVRAPSNAASAPVLEVALAQATVGRLGPSEAVRVALPSGAVGSIRRRDRPRARRMLGTVLTEAALILLGWPGLARRYRGAAANLTSPAGWETIFDDAPDAPPL